MGVIGQFFVEVFTNKVFLSMFFSFLVSVLTKISIVLASEKNPNLSAIYRSGGMPSTHTAAVVGMTLGVLFFEGVGTLFVIALAFSIVIIHDSMGVRYQA
ncbi:divergent PAP2 family protein, partial [Candidatus Woesearchaeota archaeon]|nr:divergent PAP2 family protein [Candidatus Woesearchaeota archaeon]